MRYFFFTSDSVFEIKFHHSLKKHKLICVFVLDILFCPTSICLIFAQLGLSKNYLRECKIALLSSLQLQIFQNKFLRWTQHFAKQFSQRIV